MIMLMIYGAYADVSVNIDSIWKTQLRPRRICVLALRGDQAEK